MATRACPECDGDVRASGDESVCAECGLVVSADRLDRGPEWRSFEDDDPQLGHRSNHRIDRETPFTGPIPDPIV
jgi:transcription initiation factor TFIIIB Brf1 subunit/transcription initiation factor TFIIB